MISDQFHGARAGFWRRLFASLIDLIAISTPLQLIVALLFVVTSGHIQMGSSGVSYTICSTLETVPEGLVPPPPGDSNMARECDVYFFGAQTAKILNVGRVTVEGTTTKIISRMYMLDRDGHPIEGFWVDWIVMVALIAYVIAMETRTGATLGSRAMRIRVVDVAAPAEPGVPLRKIVMRYLATMIGLLPIIIVLLIYVWKYGLDIDETAAGQILNWFFMAGIVLFGWIIFLCVQIAKKRDPLYDRVAGTAVERA